MHKGTHDETITLKPDVYLIDKESKPDSIHGSITVRKTGVSARIEEADETGTDFQIEKYTPYEFKMLELKLLAYKKAL